MQSLSYGNVYKDSGAQCFHTGGSLEEEASHISDINDRVDFRQGFITARDESNDMLMREKAATGAVKFDTGKAPILQGCVQRFPLAIEQVSRISAYGKAKYGTFDGWEKLEDAVGRYSDALGRHLLLAKSEGPYDVGDSGLPHMGQVAWNALAVLELLLCEGVVEMTSGNDIGEDGKPVLGSNGRSNS